MPDVWNRLDEIITCRTGSLEKEVNNVRLEASITCRTGSLEKHAECCRLGA